MIRTLAAILKSLPDDMPQPKVTTDGKHGVIVLTFSHRPSAFLTISVRDFGDDSRHGGRGCIAWAGYTSLDAGSHTDSAIITTPADIPAELFAFIDEFAQTVRASANDANQTEQVEA